MSPHISQSNFELVIHFPFAPSTISTAPLFLLKNPWYRGKRSKPPSVGPEIDFVHYRHSSKKWHRGSNFDESRLTLLTTLMFHAARSDSFVV